MAHTLTLHDSVEGTDLALAGTAATGYHLFVYSPIMAAYSDQRNASVYMPGDYSILGKYGNVFETITVNVTGTSRDDLFVQLRALHRLIENARDYLQYPNDRTPSYVVYKPDSVTNTCYSCILGGRIDVPQIDSENLSGDGSEGDLISNVINGVIITIEREPFWRNVAPSLNIASGTGLCASTTSNPWASISLGTVLGDIDAPVALKINNSTAVLDTVWVGYSSGKRKGSSVNGAGLYEVEDGSLGTDTSAVVDATASPGAGSSKAQCTFATTATDAERVTKTVIPGYGVFRVFARCQLSAAGTVSIYLKSKSSTSAVATKVSNAPVTITHTAWRMIDLGVVSLPADARSAYQTAGVSRSLIISASRSAGACSLDVDFLFLLPIDEGVIQAKGVAIGATTYIIYNNEMPGMNMLHVNDNLDVPMSFPQWSGLIRPLPGTGYLYVLAGDANFANVYAAAGANYVWTMYANAAYLLARGNG